MPFLIVSLPSQSLNAAFIAQLEEARSVYQSQNQSSTYWRPFPQSLLFSYQNELLQRYSFIEVKGAGTSDVNGIYYPIGILNKAFVWENCHHMYLSREMIGDQMGWMLGNMQMGYYGQPSQSLFPPTHGWRVYKGQESAPEVFCHLMGESCCSAQLRASQETSRKVVRWGLDLKRQFM